MADFTEDYKEFLEKLGGNVEKGMEFLFSLFDFIVEYPLKAFKFFLKKYADLAKQLKRSKELIKKYHTKYGVLND